MDLDRETLALFAAWYAVFVLSTTLHEAAHAWAAMRLGDLTAYYGGQVTLNPLPHIQREPFGMVLVPILTFFMNGWMMGWASAPYDPHWAQRYPRKAALMALAGPASNLLLVLIAGLLIRLGILAGTFEAPPGIALQIAAAVQPGWAVGAAKLLSILFLLNLVLFAFNLLPLPPLDGSALLPLVLPGAAAAKFRELAWNPAFSIIGLIVAWKVFGSVFPYVYRAAIDLLYLGVN
jgi:Zn-dependent protease